MNLFGRLLFVILRSLSYRGKRFAALEPASLFFRVWPHDLDSCFTARMAREVLTAVRGALRSV